VTPAHPDCVDRAGRHGIVTHGGRGERLRLAGSQQQLRRYE